MKRLLRMGRCSSGTGTRVRVQRAFTTAAAVRWAALLLVSTGLVGETLAGSADTTLPTPPAAAEPPGRPLHLIWEGINFQVSSKSSRSSARKGGERDKHQNARRRRLPWRRRERKRQDILRDVCGEALPGRLLAIMGPSGSGKSSLLNVLAGRVPAARQNRLEGTVTIGEVPLRDFDTQRYVAYVRQQQSFYPFLTVKETLLITAGLRMDRSVSRAQKENIVWDIMEKLGLSRSADTLVGDLRTPGISGGEKRRLAMGLQLIGLESPSIIFLDEPTSGLDSHQALQVMATVRDLCAEGHTVVVAIHQPRSSIYALFDDILLLSDGMVMYHGSTHDVLPRLASLGYRCPTNFNPADFMVDLISPPSEVHGASAINGRNEEAKVKVLATMVDAASEEWKVVSAARHRGRFSHENQRRWWQAGIGDGTEEEEEEEVGEEAVKPLQVVPARRGGGQRVTVFEPIGETARPRNGSGWPTQFGLLLRRSWKQATRDVFAAVARVALGFGLGGVFGSIFWKLGQTESSIQNRVSLFVNVAMNTAMFGCIRALQALATERGVVALERMDEGYSASAYLSSKILAEFPMDTVFPLIFGSTVYFAAGLNNPIGGCVKLAKFLGTLLVQAHASSALGLMVGSLSPSMEAANLIGPAMIIVSLMLSGVHENIPPFLGHLKTVSIINWGIQGIVTNEMRGIKFVPDGKKILMGWKLGTNQEVIPGEDVMEKLGFRGEGLGKPTRRLLQLSLGCHATTLLSLLWGVPRFQKLEGSPCPSSQGSDDCAGRGKVGK